MGPVAGDHPRLDLPHHRRRPAADARGRLGADRRHRLGPRPDRLPFKSAYVAAKHGQVGFVKVCALETAQEAITCNAICPGYVLTPLVEAQIPDTMKQYGMDRETVIREVLLDRQFLQAVRHDRADRPDRAPLPLLPAAEQITGTTISVDGGWTAL